jgi:hypothetical protein
MSAIEGSRQASIRRVLASLVEERRHLRRTGADGALLEASGIAIAYWRNELVHSETDHNGPWPGMAADRASPSAGEGV